MIALGSNVSETIITCHSSSISKSGTSSSEHEDDQATAADVDVNMEYCDSQSFKQRKTFQNNCAYSKTTKTYSSKNEIENDRVYQHLNNIDMTMVRDTMPQTSKHFSICILPHFESDSVKSMKVLSHDRQYAFKKEILYP